VLETKSKGRAWSEDVASELRKMEDRPWAEWKGRGITKWQLAELLSRLHPPIKPIHGLRIGGFVHGGYELGQFKEHRLRYLTK
jgi:Protein of unknown function (DUF3631)